MNMPSSRVVTEQEYRKFVDLLGSGLVRGLGVQEPGKMCIEAAWCCALGLPHGDDPGCVGAAVRAFKIRLNDTLWSSNAARAKGMLKLGIAQIGSDSIDQQEFRKKLAKAIIQRIVPIALNAAAAINPERKGKLQAAALLCEKEGSYEAARNASAVDRAQHDASDAALGAANYADTTFFSTGVEAIAAAHAVAAVTYTIRAAGRDKDEMLTLAADLALEILIDMKSPGCKYLYLVSNKE